MAKITVAPDANLPQWVLDILDDIYVPMVDEMSEMVIKGKYPEKDSAAIARAAASMEWRITASQSHSGVFEFTINTPGVLIVRKVSKNRGFIDHSFFELSQKLQGAGIADHVMNASVKIADKLGIKAINLHANLDIGGYAWFRRGFFPDRVSDFHDIINDSRTALATRLKGVIADMDVKQIKAFVLTEAFSEYKDVFLSSHWLGAVDLSDDVARTALIKGAKAASKIAARGIGIPTTSNELLQDRLVKHQTYLMRYAGSIRNTGMKTLISTEADVAAALMHYTTELEGLDVRGVKARAIFAQMADEIQAIRAEAWDALSENALDEFQQLATIESASIMKIIDDVLPVVIGLQPIPISQLKSIVKSQPFEGKTLAEWLARNKDLDYERIVTNAKNAMVAGQTPTQVARSIVGTSGAKFKDGKTRKAFNDLEAVYLTVTNGITGQVRQDLYEQNSDIITEEIYLATLDIRTTFECAGHDGKVFKRAQGPLPPLHFRCRSLRMPYLNADNLLTRPYKPTYEKELLSTFAKDNGLGKVRTIADLPRGYKTAYNAWARAETRSRIGTVPALTNFNSWLKNQDVGFQNEYLGVGRADIFRQGKLSLDKFVTRDGYELTISELKKLAA